MRKKRPAWQNRAIDVDLHRAHPGRPIHIFAWTQWTVDPGVVHQHMYLRKNLHGSCGHSCDVRRVGYVSALSLNQLSTRRLRRQRPPGILQESVISRAQPHAGPGRDVGVSDGEAQTLVRSRNDGIATCERLTHEWGCPTETKRNRASLPRVAPRNRLASSTSRLGATVASRSTSTSR